MCPHGSSTGKTLFTQWAGVWLHSSVDSTVLIQATGIGEGLVTGGAGNGPISCVCPLVDLQVSRHIESLVAQGAGIWFLSGVDSYVPPQIL